MAILIPFHFSAASLKETFGFFISLIRIYLSILIFIFFVYIVFFKK